MLWLPYLHTQAHFTYPMWYHLPHTCKFFWGGIYLYECLVSMYDVGQVGVWRSEEGAESLELDTVGFELSEGN